MNSRLKYSVVFSSTLLAVLLLIGSMMGKSAPVEGPSGVYKHLGVYSEVLSRIKSEYVEEPDMKNVTLGAMNGLLEAIDPFASYLNADQYKEYLKNFDTYRGDLGLVLAKKFGYIAVVGAVPGSPAAKAGLTTGDMIESIKGVATRDMPLAYANLLLRGVPGSSVDLTVLRRRPDPQKMTLTRVAITAPAVASNMLEGKIGYIHVETLGTGKLKEITADLKDLQAKGAHQMILDLRNCSVGNPEDGVELANLFLDKGLITYVKGQKFPREDHNADAGHTIWKGPLVVLTNRATAAAAEVAAAALGGNKRAEVIGERTYGDASIRRPVTLDDGSAVILSVAKFYAPDGKSIQDNGVTPSTIVQEVDTQPDVDESGEAVPPAAQEAKPVEDLILKKALEVLGKKA